MLLHNKVINSGADPAVETTPSELVASTPSTPTLARTMTLTLVTDTSEPAPVELMLTPNVSSETEPGTAQSSPEPAAAEPTFIESAPVEPAASEPVHAEPAPTEPAPVEPTFVESAPVEPAASEPVHAEPAPVEPTFVESAPVEPAASESVHAEPAPTEPAPVEAALVPVEPTPEDAAVNVVDAEALFAERQREGEIQSEKRAKEQVVEWLKNKTSLEQAIDEALKDHLEIHEKAHSIRLMFEVEKSALLAKVRESSRSSYKTTTDPSEDFYFDLEHEPLPASRKRERPSPTDALELEGPVGGAGGAEDVKLTSSKMAKKFVTPTKGVERV